jgi:tRNA A-37 threonylcarbamoyl transferase component Bud32
MVKIILNSRYKHLRKYVEQIPTDFENIAHIIKNDRNDVRLDFVGNYKLVVKSFKGMYLPNKVAYSLFRKSKARRSYETSLRFSEKGFLVPEPIACIDCYRYGFLTEGYYISTYYENTSFNEMLAEADSKNLLLSSFVKFTEKLHRAGIYHKDYTNGNILCNHNNGELTFCLVDLNRVRFGPVDFGTGVSNFSTLNVSTDDLADLIRQYAELHGRSAKVWLDNIIGLKRKREQFSRLKKHAKAVFFPGRLRRQATAV